MTGTRGSGASTAGSGSVERPARKPRKKLAPSQKYEVFTAVLTSSATQRELAEKYGIDRTTIRSICATAKQGALDALAAAVPGRRGRSPEQVELDHARREAILATTSELAGQAHRTLAVAFRDLASPDELGELDEQDETDLCFAGVVAMIDPPRTEAAESIASAQGAMGNREIGQQRGDAQQRRHGRDQAAVLCWDDCWT